uniref:HYLS1_C domain-containing protein n=1 Tax=Caenorhabditis tropicalis TaxID=1561998 RepID=A0A1I7U6P2_9PELO
MDNYATEKELEDIVHQMGLNIRSGVQLAKLKTEINRYLDEESCLSETDNDVLDESMFASLSIDPAAQFLRRDREDVDENMAIQSPIVSRKRRGKNSVYESVEFQNDFNDENSKESFEAKSLIDQAWLSIHRAYKTCRAANEVVDGSTDDNDHDISDEEIGDEQVSESVSVGGSSSLTPPLAPNPKTISLDPSVRPVRSPKPGRVPYKFDPVTRYHLYKSEWERHPAPGEMRRLSLRWKVREFMLRHDVPRLTANTEGKANHDKDWSPRPYMD